MHSASYVRQEPPADQGPAESWGSPGARPPSIDCPGTFLSCQDLTFRYGRAEEPVFSHISFSVRAGEAVLLMGPSGCGKSTFAYCLAGLYPEYAGHMEGSIFLEQLPLSQYGPALRARKLSILFQNPDNQFCMDRVDHEVMFALENIHYQGDIRERTRTLLDQVGLLDVEQAPIHTLSGGMKQKLALCTALATEARMLILDEPFANLDPASCTSLAGLLAELNRQGMTLLVVDHHPRWWRPFLSRVVFMEKEGDLDASSMTPEAFDQGKEAFQVRGLFYDDSWLEGIRRPAAGSVREDAQPDLMVEAEDLAIFHGKTLFMEHLSFRIPKGSVTALVGACGSGKTTLLHALAGIGRCRGCLRVHGRPGLVFQNPRFQFLATTVEDEILMTLGAGASPRSSGPDRKAEGDSVIREAAHRLLKEFGLLALKDHSPYAISQGQQRRLALLSMVAGDCPLMLLDEPTYAQDQQATRLILELLKGRVDQGLTVVMATHDLELAEAFADQVFVVDRGKIFQMKREEKT